MRDNDSSRFERVPATDDEREVEGRPSREAVLEWWETRFGLPPESFADFTFWEKGAGKLWAFHDTLDYPVRAESLGLAVLRVRQEHWKPTTDAAQRFGNGATRNVLELDAEGARAFLRGEDREIEWDGDWGYLFVTHELAGAPEPIGVGLYLHGELRSRVPKSRQRTL
jgi:NOL1/NOP2/fmu family ribosome biogenesis protein